MQTPDMENITNWTQEDLLANLGNLIEQTFIVEKQYNELTSLFGGVIEVMPVAVWVLNDDGTTYLANGKAKGIALDPATLTPDDHDSEIEVQGRHYILQVARQNGKIIIAATDNTKSRRNERLIAMGQMAAHLAHEIRNPVGSVAILASTLFNRVDLGAKSLVLEIKKSIWRVERIVKATLLFSKGFTLNPNRFTLADLNDDLNLAVQNYSYSKPIRFQFTLPPESIHADSDLLGLVLQNLIFNAIDAIEEGDDEQGCVEVYYSACRDHHTLDVYDSGPDFIDRDRIFEAFHTTKTKGHGLGLILSRQIIEAHRGEIGLCDNQKGFRIRLPKALD
jgi:signal transduction histidine kinase